MAKGSIIEIRKKLAKMHEMLSTSYHECSHVLYGILYFIEISKVELKEEINGRISGFTHFNSFEPKDFDNMALLKQLAINDIGLRYAGLAGEKIFFKKISGSDNFPLILKDGSSEDMSEAAKIIEKYNVVESGQVRYIFKKKIFMHVSKELECHWEDVILLSHLLYKKKTLEYKEIKNCLIKKSKDKKFWKEKFRIIELIHNQNGINYTILRDLILK